MKNVGDKFLFPARQYLNFFSNLNSYLKRAIFITKRKVVEENISLQVATTVKISVRRLTEDIYFRPLHFRGPDISRNR